MMGDTTAREHKIKLQVTQQLTATKKTTRKWSVPTVSLASIAIILLLFTSTFSSKDVVQPKITNVTEPLTVNTINNMDISKIYKNYQLSDADINILAKLPKLSNITSLQYIEADTFPLPNEENTFQTVIERMQNLDNVDMFYTKDSIVRITIENIQQVHDTYYTIIGSPGNTIEITGGQVFINNKLSQSDLLTTYNKQGNILRDVPKQHLNRTQFFVVNRFPTKKTPQIAYVVDARNILGKVVGTIPSDSNHSLFLMPPFISEMDAFLQVTANTDYGPEAYLDYYIFSLLRTKTPIIKLLSSENVLKQPLGEDKWHLFLVYAAWRKVEYVSPTEAHIIYKIPGTIEKRFIMKKYFDSTVWQVDNYIR